MSIKTKYHRSEFYFTSLILNSGFESETDTEEFEKVGQSPNERKLSAAATAVTIATSTSQLKVETVTISTTTERVEMQTAQTSTEVNID